MENEKLTENKNDIIIGRNAVLEALRSEKTVDTVWVAKGERHGSIGKIIAVAKENGVTIKEVSAVKLEALSNGGAHQGVAASIAAADYCSVADILKYADEKGEKPFVIIADGIEDPHNLGAIIRTAEAAGAHGIIIPKRHSATVTGIVYKTSAGACAHMHIAKVANLAAAVEELKQSGVWIYGADMDGKPWCTQDFGGGVGLVIGSEGEGISRLIKEKCDFTVSMPMLGNVTSLNASVAGGILMYEIARQRTGLKSF